MSAKKGPTISEQVIKILMEHGPKKVADMMPYINIGTAKSVHSKCLDMTKMGMMSHDADMVWTLKPGVTPMTLVTGKLQDGTEKEGEGMTTETGKDKPPGGGGEGAPLDPRDKFTALVKSTGVKTDIIPTITAQFFNGDVNSLDWLRQVLLRNAAGFVETHQARMIITTWAQMCHLPYDPKDFPLEEPEKGKGGKAAEEKPPKSAAATVIEESGIGYKIVKDKDGDWVPAPGGPLSYQGKSVV